MRQLIESVISLQEIKKTLDDIKDIEITKTKHSKSEVRQNDKGKDAYYSGDNEDIEYSTSHGRYNATRSAGGHHKVKYTPHADKHPNDGTPGSIMYKDKDRKENTTHLKHMNALHNNYIKNHVSSSDTMSIDNVSRNEYQSPTEKSRKDKLEKFMQRHKDFHKKDDNSDDTSMRTTFIRHPKTGKAVATSDSNEYNINRIATRKTDQLSRKDTHDNKLTTAPETTGSKIKKLLNKKLF